MVPCVAMAVIRLALMRSLFSLAPPRHSRREQLEGGAICAINAI